MGLLWGGASQIEKLYGGTGDDKMWLVNPEQRELDILAGQNYGYGGEGSDHIFGTDGNDIIAGE